MKTRRLIYSWFNDLHPVWGLQSLKIEETTNNLDRAVCVKIRTDGLTNPVCYQLDQERTSEQSSQF